MLSRTWARIALSYTALVLITAGVLAFLLGEESVRREEEALRARLADQARAAAYAAGQLFVEQAPRERIDALARDLGSTFDTRVTLIRPDGVVLGDSEEDAARMENHAGRPEVAQALSDPRVPGSSSRLSSTVGRRLLYVAVAVTDPGSGRTAGVARVAYPMTSVEQAQAATWRNLALAVLLVSLPAVVLGTLVARSIVGPISMLRDAADRFGRGNLEARAYGAAGGEVGDLSREFNAMADRLSTTVRERTAERNQMAAVLAHMHDGVVITDAQGYIVSMNPAAAMLFDTTPEGAAGRSVIEATHSYELHQALRAILSGGVSAGTPGTPARTPLEIASGRRSIAAVVTAVPGSDGGAPTGLIVLQDVTELRRLERVRRDFVANIGHELRTPLASIKLLVETLNGAIRDDPEAAEDFLRRIDVEIDGLTQLVRELLELSRIESGQVQLDRKEVAVAALLERAAGRLRAQAERAGLTLTVEPDGLLPAACADPERVEQVLVNLLHNAIKFTPPGGQVSLRAARNGAGVRISVEDTGIGIPPEDLPRIFERFYKVDKARASPRSGGQAREGGTGLGLAVAKHIVQAHDGQIWAESELDRGTTFYVTLPSVE